MSHRYLHETENNFYSGHISENKSFIIAQLRDLSEVKILQNSHKDLSVIVRKYKKVVAYSAQAFESSLCSLGVIVKSFSLI